MKKFFRLVSMLAVAGLTFTYTSCTDYSEDIDVNKESIDAVSGKLATAEEQIKTINSTIEQLKTADSDAKSAIEALQKNSAALESELVALQKSHNADKEALEKAFAADVKTINGTIDQLKKDYAAADATLKTELEKQITDLETKLTSLETKHDNEIKDLKEAYKKADEEIKSQILANAESITNIQKDVKELNEVTIPALVSRVAALEAFKKTQEEANATFATKVALADSTRKVIALVNENVANLTTRLDGVGSRMDSLAKAHNALKASFEEAQQNHETEIAAINAKIKELKATQGEDVSALMDSLEVARTAYENAQKSADAAAKAAQTAQTTADSAAEAAEAAQTTADSALDKANTALADIKSLKDALGVYANGGLEAKIDAMVAEELRTALRDSVANKTVNERVDSAVANIYAKIEDLFDVKYDQSAFKTAFKELWDDQYVTSFTEALKGLSDITSPAYAAWKKQFNASFTAEFNEAIKDAVLNGNVVNDSIAKQVDRATKAIQTEIDDKISKVNTSIGQIKLVIDDITNNRIQSIVFVPEYDDMNATLYNYRVNNVALSDTYTVKATFEVYPPKVAKTLAESISNRIEDETSAEIASVVAVKVGSRAASKSCKGNIVAVNEADGRIALTVNFDKSELEIDKVGYDKVPFAISLRVQEDINKTVGEDKYATGNYVESAFVGVKLAKDSELNDKFVVFIPQTNTKVGAGTDNSYTKEMPWSVENSYWNPFDGCEFGLSVGTEKEPKYLTLAEAAEYYNLNEGVFKVTLSSYPTFSKTGSTSHAKFFKYASEGVHSLAELGTSIASDKLFDKDGNLVDGVVGAYCRYDVSAIITTAEIGTDKKPKTEVIFKAKTDYKIVHRKVTVELYKADDPYKVNWSYDNALKLTGNELTSAKAYGNPIDKSFDAELGAVKAEIDYNEATLKNDLDLKAILSGTAVQNVYEVVNGKVSESPLAINDKIYPTDKTSSDKYEKLPVLSEISEAAGTKNLLSVAISNYKNCFTGKTYELRCVYKYGEAVSTISQGTEVEVKMYVAFDKCPTSVDVNLDKVSLEYIPDEVTFTELSDNPVEKAYAAIVKGLPENAFVAKDKLTALDQFATSLAASQVCSDIADWVANSSATAKRTSPATAALKGNSTYLVPFDSTATGKAINDSERPAKCVSYVRASGNANGIKSFKDNFSFATQLKTWYGPVFNFKATADVLGSDFKLGYHDDLVKDASATIEGQLVDRLDGDGNVVKNGDGTVAKVFKFKQADLAKYFKVLRGESENLLSYVGDKAYSKLSVTYSILNKENAKTGYENVGGTVNGVTFNNEATNLIDKYYTAVPSLEISVPSGFDSANDKYLEGTISSCVLEWNDYTSRDLKVQAKLKYGDYDLDTKVITLKAKDYIEFGAFEKIDEETINKSVDGTLEIVRERKPNEDLVVDIWRFLSVKSTVEGETLDNQILQTADTYRGRWHHSGAGDRYGIDLKFELLSDQITIGTSKGTLPSDKLTFIEDAEAGTDDEMHIGRLTYKADAATQANDVVIPVKVTLTHKYNWCEGVQDDHSVIIKVKVPAAK